MTRLTAKPHKDGVELKLILQGEKLPELPALKYSEREIEIATKAWTHAKCGSESLEQYLKRIGAK